ncbi:hypothetical protein BZG02_05295 [Labilibaculum filiforme]|uniref:TonB-dependent receptor plug domain-containing protein n=1 Tax=Labilibaculum filiforme TaxID=1940526 RepID=A0A2N3I1P7_9BACT|nr:TonB-dependent receptor plug domain-containing protein [Labilibaculum filiforme]PKQ64238.1 hypothetical protein BZG02_05295 [Labilibaculum filiforme]
MKLKLGIIVFLLACGFATLHAQTTVLKGKVTAFKTYPLNKVLIESSKSKQNTLTDENGNYEITINAKKDVVKFRADGFVGQTIRIKGETESSVNLLYINNESSHYNVINNKTLTEENLDYCIKNCLEENNNFDRMSSIFQVIQYVYPSSKMESVNGMNQVFLTSRGPSSVSSGLQALLVVNGIITEDITGISPGQVKSVEVLLGNEAADYGSRAANGVVIIKLKN